MIMDVAIIFHSVQGNTYLLAKAFNEAFKNKGVDVGIFRVEDVDLDVTSKIFKTNDKSLAEIQAIPIAKPEAILNCKLAVIGSPTYFGNMSAEMKTYLDATAIYYMGAQLAGKKLAAFSSAGNSEGSADMCLKSIITYGQHMGMINIPAPANLMQGEPVPAYGLMHYSYGKSHAALDEKLATLVEKYVDWLIQYM